ncbi:MAG: 1-acyl-sn-glycerol-3-phosphate acyltransferase [Oscillospiraceae bacterium]|nr:1-acyl-sn-glycerol-3-phosphate acyltransferase [Oscillospiraceae bacterium]
MSVFGSLQKSFIAGFFRKLFRVKIINSENEPLEQDAKSYVACINHSSNWDPILIGACMHRPLRYMAKSELFKIPVLKSIVKLFGAYPVKRDAADVGSVKATINILENGEIVGIYPQGKRAKRVHPETVALKSGVAMFAYKAKTGILPVTVISKGYKVRAFHKTIVVFGEYIPFEELEKITKYNEGMSNIELYKIITDRVYGIILENYKKYDTLNKNKIKN